MAKKFFLIITTFFLLTSFFSCKKDEYTKSILEFEKILKEDSTLPEETRYAILNRIAIAMHEKDPNEMILFLTDWVEKNPQDKYNAYWLFMVAKEYMNRSKDLYKNTNPIAEYYFERILRNYSDLLINGQSIHFACLQNLIKISKNSVNRISYFSMLIDNFPKDVSKTEMYVRLALEYEKEGDWKKVLDTYEIFLKQPDASTIQIPSIPDAYANAKKIYDFSKNKNKKNWTFDSLKSLEKAIKIAINNYDWKALDSYRSEVNFFTMSWKTSESDSNAQEEFSMRNFMRGNRIKYNAELDETTNSRESYLRTTGWSTYVNVWYFYFRKVNFPNDPEIHGRWEWAGIYLGEKL